MRPLVPVFYPRENSRAIDRISVLLKSFRRRHPAGRNRTPAWSRRIRTIEITIARLHRWRTFLVIPLNRARLTPILIKPVSSLPILFILNHEHPVTPLVSIGRIRRPHPTCAPVLIIRHRIIRTVTRRRRRRLIMIVQWITIRTMVDDRIIPLLAPVTMVRSKISVKILHAISNTIRKISIWIPKALVSSSSNR